MQGGELAALRPDRDVPGARRVRWGDAPRSAGRYLLSVWRAAGYDAFLQPGVNFRA